MKIQFICFIIFSITFIQCQKSLNSTVKYVDNSYFQGFKDTFNFKRILKESDVGIPNIMLPVPKYEAGFHKDTLAFQVIDSYCGTSGYILYVNIIKDKFQYALIDLTYGQFINSKIIEQSLKIENKSFTKNEKIKVAFFCEAVPLHKESHIKKYTIEGKLELSCYQDKNINDSYFYIDNVSKYPDNWLEK